ncbi:hypothetical protein DAPPUDRAFT_235890 [Daphnia pulex]|uniref:Uncharacterized protein n=1 Tax=Daphnia pulex TaxID=6669 RepID=E9FZB8_DAPPU|nr:hypothetical protein DAPPUDRAFT_235890 [Daphnia pulex]|eukprot:EFX87289.1 hypothetical protein DAPPUDRAFT_235890 [Daphnia pulex]
MKANLFPIYENRSSRQFRPTNLQLHYPHRRSTAEGLTLALIVYQNLAVDESPSLPGAVPPHPIQNDG